MLVVPAVASRQRGRFTAAQALAEGVSRSELATMCRRGALVHLRRSVYADARRPPPRDAREGHLDDVVAEQLALEPGWYAARRSAAVAWGVPLIGEPPVVPQLLTDPGLGDAQGRDRHQRVARLPREDRWRVDGVPTVSLPRLVADIGRAESLRNAVVVADDVLGRGVERAELERVLRGMRRWPGVVAARKAVAFADGRAESPLESVSRVAVHVCDLPAPELQVEVWLGGVLLARVDHLWRELRTVGEADGLAKYLPGDSAYVDRRAAQQVVERQRAREQALVAAGLQVVRWSWADA
ncbi:MAG: type IV toxin-antitoxin system AbiEi family antitoxin domain-containing protein, partial [Nocardioidaceae bacterium]